MNLLVKSPVWDDLREIGLRIAAENPDAADRFLTAARESFELLRRHPAHWTPAKLLSPWSAVMGDSGLPELSHLLPANRNRGADSGGVARSAGPGQRVGPAVGIAGRRARASD